MILIGCTVIDQTETSYSISIGQSFWLLYSQMDEVCERNNFSITIQHFCEFSQKQRALDFINSVSGFISTERERPKFICNRSNHGRHFRKKFGTCAKTPNFLFDFSAFGGCWFGQIFCVLQSRFNWFWITNEKAILKSLSFHQRLSIQKTSASSRNCNSNLEINHSFIFLCSTSFYDMCWKLHRNMRVLSIYWPDVIFSESLHTFACIRCRIRTPIFPFECKIRKLG